MITFVIACMILSVIYFSTKTYLIYRAIECREMRIQFALFGNAIGIAQAAVIWITYRLLLT